LKNENRPLLWLIQSYSHWTFGNSQCHGRNTDLSKVWFIVSPQNPLKPSKGLLHEFDRYDMVKAAIADNYKLEVSDVEFHLTKPSYTIHTLVHLRERYPDKEFKVIVW